MSVDLRPKIFEPLGGVMAEKGAIRERLRDAEVTQEPHQAHLEDGLVVHGDVVDEAVEVRVVSLVVGASLFPCVIFWCPNVAPMWRCSSHVQPKSTRRVRLYDRTHTDSW